MSSTENDAASSRLGEFEAEVAGLRIKGGSLERERQMTSAGTALMVVGLGLGIVMAVLSSGASDTRDSLTYLSVGLVALSLTVVGALMWLRYSLTHYLRYWLLRMIFEQRSGSGN